MTIKNVQQGGTGQVEDLKNQLESSQSTGNTGNSNASGTIFQKADHGRDQRLAEQLMHSRMSICSLQRQEQMAGLIGQRADSEYSRERLNQSCQTISSAAANTNAFRRARTEQSLEKAKDIIDNGTRSERAAIGSPLN